MESFDYLKSFYEAKDEDVRLLTRRGNVEFQTTVRYIEKYLKKGMRVLEIGAGTGRYSHYFARCGYTVDAVELIPHNVDVFRKNTEAEENVTVSQGDARDLSRYPDETFDITLSLGPMYHLYTDADKEKALAEAIRVTKKGGLLFVAYCMNEPTIIQYCFVKKQWRSTMERGMLDEISIAFPRLRRSLSSIARRISFLSRRDFPWNDCISSPPIFSPIISPWR